MTPKYLKLCTTASSQIATILRTRITIFFTCSNGKCANFISSQDSVLYWISIIRSRHAEGRYMLIACCGGFSCIRQIITWFDSSHHQSDEQMQHDCNSDIFRGNHHMRVHWFSDIVFTNLSSGYERQFRPIVVYIPCIMDSKYNDILSNLHHSRLTAAEWVRSSWSLDGKVNG